MNLSMQLTDILQVLLIALAVLASALYWLRRLAPGLWASLTGTRAPAADPRGACDSGCSACNGCGGAATDARSRESVIRFEHRG